jgi:hypothetical protein
MHTDLNGFWDFLQMFPSFICNTKGHMLLKCRIMIVANATDPHLPVLNCAMQHWYSSLTFSAKQD